MSFATQEEIYKRFQENDTPDVLLGTIRLLGKGITTLTRARQIVIVDLDYNASLGDLAE